MSDEEVARMNAFCKTALQPLSVEFNDIFTDFKDGTKLCQLAEALVGRPMGRFNKRPRMVMMFLDNIRLALEFLAKNAPTRVRTELLNPQDIVDGDRKQIMSLIFQLMQAFPNAASGAGAVPPNPAPAAQPNPAPAAQPKPAPAAQPKPAVQVQAPAVSQAAEQKEPAKASIRSVRTMPDAEEMTAAIVKKQMETQPPEPEPVEKRELVIGAKSGFKLRPPRVFDLESMEMKKGQLTKCQAPGVPPHGHCKVKMNSETGRILVVKEVMFGDRKGFDREVNALMRLSYPTIVEIEGFVPPSTLDTGYIAMEYCPNGSLEDLLRKAEKTGEPIDHTKLAVIIMGTAFALHFCHVKVEGGKHLMHRNLAPCHILIDENFQAKLCSFTKCKDENELGRTQGLDSNIAYAAPEIKFCEDSYGCSVDVYSFAVVLVELLGGLVRPKGRRGMTFNFTPTLPDGIPENLASALSMCLSNEPETRPTMDGLIALFEAMKYKFWSDVDSDLVASYVKALRGWEAQATSTTPLYAFRPKRKNEIKVYAPGELEQIKKLGSGSFGKVYLVKTKDGTLYAAKSLKEKLRPQDMEAFMTEMDALNKMDHPTVLDFGGIEKDGDQPRLLLTEYIENGCLKQLVEGKAKGEGKERWNDHTTRMIVIMGICLGMRYIHERNYLHRDLKPENIFLDKHWFPRIGDLGTVREESIEMSCNVGTPLYIAPEMFKDKGTGYTKAIDIFSFTATLYEIIYGQKLFQNPKKRLTQVQVRKMQNDPNDRPSIDTLPEPVQQLMKGGWSPNPEERPPFHEWIAVFRYIDYKLWPDVDSEDVQLYVDSIESWEAFA